MEDILHWWVVPNSDTVLVAMEKNILVWSLDADKRSKMFSSEKRHAEVASNDLHTVVTIAKDFLRVWKYTEGKAIDIKLGPNEDDVV